MNPKTVLSVKIRNNLHWIHVQSKVLKVICQSTVLKKESIKIMFNVRIYNYVLCKLMIYLPPCLKMKINEKKTEPVPIPLPNGAISGFPY